MSVENPEVAENNDIFVKPMNGGLNGVRNGHSLNSSTKHSSSSSSHKSSSKDKHRDKDRDKSSSKSSSSSSRDKDRDKDRDKEKSRHSSSSHSSSSKDKDKEKSSSSSSHKSSNRDKDREKDKDKDRDRHRDKDKDSKHRDKDRDAEKKDKDKDKDREKNKDKPRDKDGTSSSNRDKDRDREKSGKSTSSSSNRDKEKSSSSRDKDRKSSSNKDKHSSSSSSKSSRDKDKYKDKYSSSKDRAKDKENDENNAESEKVKNAVDSSDNATPYTTESNNLNNDVKHEKESCFDYNGPIKTETDEPQIKPRPEFLNSSQASSCDYSLSQFREDEAQFVIKEEAAEENSGQGEENGECEDVNLPLNKRKSPVIEDDDEENIPLLARYKMKKEEDKKKKIKLEVEEDDEDDVPLLARKRDKKAKKKKAISEDEDDDYDDVKPKKKKMKKEKKEKSAPVQVTRTQVKIESPQKTGGRKKKEEPVQEVWKWWEEEKRDDGVKWHFLEHKGPIFAPVYVPLPDNVKFYYDGNPMKLSLETEEVACFYAKMLEHDYTSKKAFNDNFFKDWRKFMTSKEKDKISNLHKCNFQEMCDYFKAISEKNKTRSKEEKEAIKLENEKLLQEYGYCTIDGHKEKIGNFKIEPPGLFRGRGEHPKMGHVKRRLMPEDVSINCSKDSKIPVPPAGHRWKEVRHDNQVTWLASWVENVQGQVKYIMLNPSSKLKGEKDWQKYETARRLHKTIDKIRATYRDEWKSKEMRIRQRAVALYFIDKLALRAGNEKDEDQADTVGCCSLRVEHITLHKELDGKEHVVVFDFLGKDSIRYYNEVDVEKRVFKNLELFKENKKDGDDLFDRLNTTVLNEHLRELMEGLTAKVFRTYNASITLQRQLDELTDPDSSLPEKLLSYNRANRAVAILCNHQRSVPKSHSKSMANLKDKINTKRDQINDGEIELKDLKKEAKRGSVKEKLNADKKSKQLERLKEQLKKLELQETDRDENKTIALGTSKLNYLDPRISVAWCKKYEVPIEKIFNKTQRDKFRWAIDMANETYSFIL